MEVEHVDDLINDTLLKSKCRASRVRQEEQMALAQAAASTSRCKRVSVPRSHRSRSSPVRSILSGTKSPEGRARSPSASAPRATPFPAILSQHSSVYGYALGAFALYSPRPPSTPMYLVPLPPNPVSEATQSFDSSKRKPNIKPKKSKESKRVARYVWRSLLRAWSLAVNDRALPRDNATCMDNNAVNHHLYRSIASQTKSKKTANRQYELSDEDVSFSSAECCTEGQDKREWVGDVRALRDSHVRLVLQQLQQLRHIERLNRTLRHAQINAQLDTNSCAQLT